MKDVTKIRIIAMITSILIPILLVFCIVGFHSNELVLVSIHFVSFLLLFLSTAIFLLCLFLLLKNKKKQKRIKKRKEKKEQVGKLSKGKKIVFIIFISLEILGSSIFLILLYSPFKGFREWLISSAMATMSHKYLATWFYSEEEINKVLEANQLVEQIEDTDLDSINPNSPFNRDDYENEYERDIFTLEDESAPYKIIPISRKNFEGYLAVIYDPARISVVSTKYLNSVGQYVTEMAADNKALLAINGGGFLDENKKGTGGVPDGVLIKNGKVLSDRPYNTSGGVIGFTKDNKLILGKMNAKQALAKGVRDAVSFRPFLIVNGKKSFTKGNGGWGSAPRTAIGQRKDGIVLMLVVDGRTIQNPGATLVDIMNILYNYGAYNATNLDGGTSSVMVLPKEEASQYISEKEMASHCKKGYCYINDVVNGSGAHVTRPVVSSFVVK